MKFLLTILLLITLTAKSQVQTAKYTPIIANSSGFYEYLPEGYVATETYPLMIFIHGVGELGSNTNNWLPAVLQNGPPRLINAGQFPASFNVGGATHRFIVISPQFKTWPSTPDIQGVIDYCVKNYRVNTARIYLTGLSMGGGVVWNYASENLTNANKIAAIVPVCAALGADATRAKTMATTSLPVWATHNADDGTVNPEFTTNWINWINQNNPKVPAKKTIWSSGGHDAWSRTYDPNFRENGQNVYEWMLSYSRGVDKPIVTVQPTAAIPGLIEGENYTTHSGIQIGDGGYFKYAGWIDKGDWMEFNVNVATAGLYKLEVRYASPSDNSMLQVRNEKGEILNTTQLKSTGAFTSWTTLPTYLNLPAGVQKLRVVSLNANWNLNHLTFIQVCL